MGWFRRQFEERPILAGCGVAAGLAILLSCGGGLLLVGGGATLFKGAMDEMGVDGLMSLSMDAQKAGFAIGMSAGTNQEAVFTMTPVEPRVVSCEELAALLFPHLTGKREVVIAESESVTAQPGGGYLSNPVTCRWAGFPKAGSPTATTDAVLPGPPAEAPVPQAETLAPEEEPPPPPEGPPPPMP